MLHGIEEAVAGPEDEVSESWGGDGGGDADVAEEMPACGDEGGEVVELEAAEDVEHEFDGELVDGEGVELLEVETGLEALFNLCDACWAVGEGGVGHFGWGWRGRCGAGAARCGGRCTKRRWLE